jgi:hypothetical protein
MKQTGLRRLSPKDFNATLIEELTRQGRVFIAPARLTDKDSYKREVLDYVQRIADYAADAWQEDIERLWQQIVDAPCFRECLTMKNGLQAGHMNRYTVTNLVYRMRSKGVYRAEVSMLTLHLRMEMATKKNRYYQSNGNYDLCSDAKALLKKLLQRV